MLNFITGHILPHENYYIYWHRKNLWHFDEFNNCSQEGSNVALKSHAAAILLGNSIGSVDQRLHFQA
jgi:hypothetical protein